MPPKKKRPAGSAPIPSRPHRSTRQTTGRRAATNNAVPDVYQEMLAEAAANSPDDFAPSPRPAKRRKVSFDQTDSIDDLFESPPASAPDQETLKSLNVSPARPPQIVFDDFEDSDESDVEFEDVDLEVGAESVSEDESLQPKSLQLDLSKSALETPRRTVQRRKPVSRAERSMRLDVHKWHLLSLIGHGLQRNSWCNSEEIHVLLKPLVPRKVVNLLHVDEAKPLYERNHAFNKGIEEICALWRQHWTTTVHGLRRAYWRDDVDARSEADEGEDLDFDDFRIAAHKCQGSRDLGAQLFTSLLRAIAIDARLVFSVQVLPFTGAAKVETPVKSRANPNYIQAPAQNYGAATTSTNPFAPPSRHKKSVEKIIDSPFPIFWTEVLTPNQTWIPLDPVVRNTISKPKTQFEPSLSDNLNSMTYVMAYEDDNSARDVTRRYTQWFNAKTRKLRVEFSKHGEQWFSSAMAVVRKKFREPRDEIEDGELSRRVNSEGLPHNIQDFKNHPVYVLERHMRATEVLQPKREVGKINAGTAKNGKIEPIYRRQDVHLCRTADAWYRRGRDVKVGEQPLKRVVPKSRRGLRGQSAEMSEDGNDDEREGVGLYAEYQTDVYEPPPVVDGRIPKNAYGNLDVYIPSMIPPGAVHISHPIAAAAAKVIGIDFADAVTGFEFKGRQGTAIVKGIVVAEQYTAAIAAVVDSLETLGSEEAQQARSRILLGIWKRMLQALRVRERVEAEYGSTKPSTHKRNRQISDDGDENGDDDGPAYEDEDTDEDMGGGFMIEADRTEEKVQEQAGNLQIMKEKMPTVLPEELVSIPIQVTRSPHKIPVQSTARSRSTTENGGDDDLFEDSDDNASANAAGGLIPNHDEDTEMTGGGFLLDDETDQEGGGFFADDEDNNEHSNTGGGFISEDTPPFTQPNSHQQIPNPTSNPLSANRNTTTSPIPQTIPTTNDALDILHSDAEEDSALQAALIESLTSDPHITTRDTITTTDKPDPQHAVDTDTANDEREPDTASAVTTPNSVLSHDPNEDDEEPEWLNEALE